MKDADYQMPGFEASANPEKGHTRVSDFSQLIKARLTFLVLITTGVGFYLGSSEPVDVVRLLNVLLGAALAAAGASALNQWWERDLDALMSRTRTRPVPSGRMRPGSALILGCLFAIIGIRLKGRGGTPLLATQFIVTSIGDSAHEPGLEGSTSKGINAFES